MIREYTATCLAQIYSAFIKPAARSNRIVILATELAWANRDKNEHSPRAVSTGSEGAARNRAQADPVRQQDSEQDPEWTAAEKSRAFMKHRVAEQRSIFLVIRPRGRRRLEYRRTEG